MEWINKLASWLKAIGGPGLFLAAALDSFIPLAHIVDPMVVLLSYSSGNPVLFAGLAVAGSVLGTTLLFLLVRKGGERFAARRIPPERRRRIEGWLRRFGVATVVAGGILPPPFPFKGVVLLAGLARMRLPLFVVGVTLARAFRYGLEATLAVFYGDWVLAFMRERYPLIGLAAVALLVPALFLGQRLLRAPSPEARRASE